MSLDIYLMELSPHEVYESNITHNCADMARALGIYHMVWRGESVEYASDLIGPLSYAIGHIPERIDELRKLEPDNGWGTVDHFTLFLSELLAACIRHPNAEVRQSR